MFDGNFDGFKITFNRKRHLWNLFLNIALNLLVVSHLVVFISGNEALKNQLIYMRLSKGGFAENYLNLSNPNFLILLNNILIIS